MLPKHVIIVGGGLTGPALALALAKRSIASTVLERSPGVQDIGGVIMLAPNAMRVMDKILNVEPLLRSRGSSWDNINIYTTPSSSTLEHIGGFGLNHDGVQALSIARPVLHQTLVDECGKMDQIKIKYNARVDMIEEREDGVDAILTTGEKLTGDILIGADGIGSKARKHVLGTGPGECPDPYYSGIVVVGNIMRRASINLPPNVKLPGFYYTQHGTFLSFSMNDKSDDDTIQWATSIEIPERDRKTGWKEYEQSGEAVRDVKKLYAGITAEPLRSFIDGLSDDNVKLWAPYKMPDLKKWHTKRVCLIGDAAHAIPPSAGQGAAQGFEDIGLMARLLGGESPSSSASTSRTSSSSSIPSKSNGKSKGLSPSTNGAGLELDDGDRYNKIFEKFEITRRKRIDIISKMTAGAEKTRRPLSNSALWWLKRTGMKWGFWLVGKNGYLRGNDVTAYDVTMEDIKL